MKVLVTCPPMLRQIEEYKPLFAEKNIEVIAPNVVQIMTVEELLEIVPKVDGWIIGDDPANETVFRAGAKGSLKAAVKWGVGVDNVDFAICKELGIPITNTPGMFGEEVSDVAVGLMLNLTRKLHIIDREVRKGNWFKPAGISTQNKKVGIVGFGDIGKSLARKLLAFNMEVVAYDPFAQSEFGVKLQQFPQDIESLDFLFLTSALNSSTKGMVNKIILQKLKSTCIIINVSRGPIIVEQDLIEALESESLGGAGLDVFETEPLSLDSPLHKFDNCIFGSHNGSNTIEAVHKTSYKAIGLLSDFLNIN